MDSITHIVYGGCIGAALLEKRAGKKALWLGALAQSLPDADAVATFWSSPTHDLLAHRGFTHSFTFLILVAPLLALLARRLFRSDGISYGRWLLFFGVGILVHLLLDAFNAYGTGWLEPFSHCRVSFQTLFVADPFFTIWPLIAFAVLAIQKRTTPHRLAWARFGWIACTLYLGYAICNKLTIDKAVEKQLAAQSVPWQRYMATPDPFNTWLWFVVARTDKGFYITHRSVFDKGYDPPLVFVPQNDSLLDPIRHTPEVQDLLRFSQGYYTVEKKADTLIFNDLRFGQSVGWYNPHAPFVFHYYLQGGDNSLVVQRGRWAGWDAAAWAAFWKRIKGEKVSTK